MNRLLVYQILILVALLTVGCGGTNEEKQAEIQQADSEISDQLLENVDEQEIQDVISSYKGDKAVLVNVWATWCIPCVEEFPEIVEIQRKYPDDLQVVFISADFSDARNRALKFLKEHDVNWTTYFKDAKDEPFINALSRDWSGTLPFTQIIDVNGDEVAHWENKASFDKFDKHVQQAINP